MADQPVITAESLEGLAMLEGVGLTTRRDLISFARQQTCARVVLAS